MLRFNCPTLKVKCCMAIVSIGQILGSTVPVMGVVLCWPGNAFCRINKFSVFNLSFQKTRYPTFYKRESL